MTSFYSYSKDIRMHDLCLAVQHCNLCEGLCSRTKVLSENNGNINSKVLFIAEAPGRLGADRTGIPLYGDKTGNNFETLLNNIGWHREDIFISNAILCNPRNEQGNNTTPSQNQIKNCNYYLKMTIELVQPEVIVSLGRIALEALNIIYPHDLKLKENVAQPVQWQGRILFPLYHPGPRAMVHRPLTKQRGDFIVLSKLVDPLKGIKNNHFNRAVKKQLNKVFETPTKLQKLVTYIVNSLGRLDYFKLTKILYLIDLEALEQLGYTLTGEIYLRQQEGPWPPALSYSIRLLDGSEVENTFIQKKPVVRKGPFPRFNLDYDEETLALVNRVLDKYGHLSNSKIKTVAYLTRPMKYSLRQETLGRDMRKIPIIYKNQTCIDLDTNNLDKK